MLLKNQIHALSAVQRRKLEGNMNHIIVVALVIFILLLYFSLYCPKFPEKQSLLF